MFISIITKKIEKIGSNIEYNPKFLSKIKKALEFQCLIVLFISTGSSNLDDRFSH